MFSSVKALNFQNIYTITFKASVFAYLNIKRVITRLQIKNCSRSSFIPCLFDQHNHVLHKSNAVKFERLGKLTLRIFTCIYWFIKWEEKIQFSINKGVVWQCCRIEKHVVKTLGNLDKIPRRGLPRTIVEILKKHPHNKVTHSTKKFYPSIKAIHKTSTCLFCLVNYWFDKNAFVINNKVNSWANWKFHTVFFPGSNVEKGLK